MVKPLTKEERAALFDQENWEKGCNCTACRYEATVRKSEERIEALEEVLAFYADQKPGKHTAPGPARRALATPGETGNG